MKTTFTCISDTHSRHNELKIHPEIDKSADSNVLLHAGDFTNVGDPYDVRSFVRYTQDVLSEFDYIVLIAGNHDFCMEREPQKSEAQHFLNESKIIYLDHQSCSINGINIFGSPWTPEFFNWAFNYRSHIGEFIWDAIPETTDIVMTHGPCKNILDQIEEGEHVGCPFLLKRIQEIKPLVHVCGHIHEGYGSIEMDGKLFVNASLCTRRYKPTNKPIVFSMERKDNIIDCIYFRE